jgi:uncharacterized protein (TIRG00374 family)
MGDIRYIPANKGNALFMAALIPHKKNKNPWLKTAGVLIAIIPLVWIYWRLNFPAMLSILPRVAWWLAPALFLTVTVSMVLQGIRWWILLHAFLPELSLRRALSYHFMAVFYGTALPSGAAQDVIKTLFVSRSNDQSVSWAALWITRTVGLPVLALLSIFGFFNLNAVSLPRGWQYALLFFYLLITALFLISFSKRVTRPMRGVFAKIIPARILEPLENIRESIYRFRDQKKAVILSFLVTLAAQATLVFTCVISIYGITGKFPLWECFTFIPLIELISMSFPLTPNGMGIRETLSAGLFSYLNLSKEYLGIYVMFSLFFSLAPRVLGVPLILHGYWKKRNQAKYSS